MTLIIYTAKKNITIEPVIFFMTIVEYIDLVTIDQLVIDKSCRLDFNYTADVCDNLVETAYEDENTEVQNEVAQYKVKFNSNLLYQEMLKILWKASLI